MRPAVHAPIGGNGQLICDGGSEGDQEDVVQARLVSAFERNLAFDDMEQSLYCFPFPCR